MSLQPLARRLRATGRLRQAAWALAPALLLFPGTAHAAALDQYSVQVLAQSGVSSPGFNPILNEFQIDGMNNRGQILLETKTKESQGHQVLGVLSNGQFTPIAAGSGPSPDGKTWPIALDFASAGMNESGNIAFVPVDGNGNALGVYFWDAVKQAVVPVAVPGMPAIGGLVFATGGRNGRAALNNQDEVAFIAHVKPASGPAHDGVFLRRADSHIDAVALPGDPLPGQAGNLKEAVSVIVGINDTGQVTFDATGTAIPPLPSTGYTRDSVYRWENGTISLLADTGTEIPGLGKSYGFFDAGPNDQNSDVLMGTWTTAPKGIAGFVLWQEGQLVPVLLLGQDLPGGGQFGGGSVNNDFPNALGQYPFEIQFKENGKIGSGAYLVGADGKLSLIARSGLTTPLGTLTRVSPALTSSHATGGIGINQQGQVALTAQINNGPDALLLLTPKSPAGAQQTP